MNRRKFVSTVPVFAAGVTCATPLLAGSSNLASTATAQEELLSTFRKQVTTSIATTDGVSGSFAQLYTPATRPVMVKDRLHFTNKAGNQVMLFRRNDQFFAKLN